MRRTLLATLFAVLATLLPWAPSLAATATAAPDPAQAEAEFVARINDLRASKGLPTLEVHPELVSLARSWSTTMADADKIWHNPALSTSVAAPWTKLGENVGVGMTVERLFDAFVASPSHYKNLVDPAYRQIGVGVVTGRDGALFTAHEFMVMGQTTAPAPARIPAPAPAVAAAAAQPVAAPVPVPMKAAAPAPSDRVVLVLEQLRALDAA